MPIYSYEVLDKNGRAIGMYEALQRLGDDALTSHPDTGQPLRRRINAPNVPLKHTDRAEKNLVSDNKRLEQLGFTKYERKGKGYMERVAGDKGPKTLGGGEF